MGDIFSEGPVTWRPPEVIEDLVKQTRRLLETIDAQEDWKEIKKELWDAIEGGNIPGSRFEDLNEVIEELVKIAKQLNGE